MFVAASPSVKSLLHNMPKAHHENPAMRALGSRSFEGFTVVFVATATTQLNARIPMPTLVPNGDHGREATVMNNPSDCILLALTK